MASKVSLSELYASSCSEHHVQINPHILEVLENALLNKNVTLDLSGSRKCVQRLDDKDALVVSKCLKNNRRVTGLDVSYNNITDEGLKHFADLLQDDSTLNSLDLRFNDCQTDGAKALAKILQGNSTLFSLTLSGNKIGDSGGIQLAMMLQANDSLMELELAACDLGIESIITFANVLKSNRSLRRVDFSQSLLTSHQEEWLLHVSDMLAMNSSLLELHLGMAGMTDTGMERLAEGLAANRALRYLDLRCNRLSCDGASHLAGVLKQNATLDVIDLSFNRIQNGGAVHMSEALVSPGCGLRALSVSSNSIGTDGLLSLAQAVKANRTLTDINIWGNDLEEPVCQVFRQLIRSGRLPPDKTDVTPFETDGRVFLAELSNSLNKYRRPINGAPPPPTSQHTSG
ncbi:leucine-rich repeat-containing protein 34 [Takifugu rubripes]|uniref:leucine-rich repeat-containing protein 34 n=1 Tax=Takifugu rubripes TaxID=31033 RepID=UPI001145397C|nr:leucine-rich repeat-containing protein 34 [Takifugu rubripes]